MMQSEFGSKGQLWFEIELIVEERRGIRVKFE